MQADSKKLQYRAASDPQGVAVNPETNDLFSSASPEVAASITLGSNVSALPFRPSPRHVEFE
jgi:hypothetical protein